MGLNYGLHHLFIYVQGHGYGTKILDFIETFALIQKVGVVSCQTSLIHMYQSRGYVIMERKPIDGTVPNISRTDLEYFAMTRKEVRTNDTKE